MGACCSRQEELTTEEYERRESRLRTARLIKESGAKKSASKGRYPYYLGSRVSVGSIWDHYEPLDKVLGAGFSGPVKLVRSKGDGKQFAVKSFKKSGADEEAMTMLKNEAILYLDLDHPNIARLIDVFEDENNLYLVMEYMAGGMLYDRLSKKRNYTEKDAQRATYEMLLAVAYLHHRKIIHRDLKLENFLYESKEPDAKLKLIDFGFSKRYLDLRPSDTMQIVGTLYYLAPETLRGDYATAVDMWAMGVIVYMLLAGVPPFIGESKKETLKLIRQGAYSMRSSIWKSVSFEAKDFVRKCLSMDPTRRMTAKQALKHPWMATMSRHDLKRVESVDADNAAAPGGELKNALQAIKNFSGMKRLKRACMTVMAYALTSDEIDEVRNLFFAFDKGKTGTITLEDFKSVCLEHLKISDEEIEQIFDALDDTGDNEIEYTEFIAAMLYTRVKLHEGAVKRLFRKFDLDGSGTISAEELKHVLGEGFKGDIEALISSFDKDGNGTIDYNEFLQGIEDNTEAQAAMTAIVDKEVNEAPPDASMRDICGITRKSRTLSFRDRENGREHDYEDTETTARSTRRNLTLPANSGRATAAEVERLVQSTPADGDTGKAPSLLGDDNVSSSLPGSMVVETGTNLNVSPRTEGTLGSLGSV
ncbi:unnamed protein product [Vitrella brassicaformis CCMP3155]|uniref:Calmodulin n=2 Tax=Vitrella brassicaformis TaxID=1169539 RepID=A0A0G4F0C1_VITBC|nr:unnamed protein product [Vitrella brassicaformis CCMP3155]|mmetsp:Transcript_12575/g.36506  ORF Transcript_12575/g.36506 Transcript_12575/m.36506 type:complete len:647 (+) Transcript_12575:143-2083(+)|eukprot:CEM05156.1 unnamed protein product [Vitrella brassicaformis CCMP3155]